MTTAYADQNGFFQLPRKDAPIIKPCMKSWLEQGDTVFAINAVGESIVFQLTDTEGVAKEPTPDTVSELADELLQQQPRALPASGERREECE